MGNEQELARSALWRPGIWLALVSCAVFWAAKTEAAPIDSESGAIRFQSQNGYLSSVSSTSAKIITEEPMSEATAEFQSFMGINMTENLDEETARLMTSPRCGVKDEIEAGTNGRSKRYAFMGSKWWPKRLTYKISKYPRALNKRVVDREIARAFAEWSKYTDLSFSPSSGRVNIEIRFEHGFHGDEGRFDGPYRVLAHAYPPNNMVGTHVHFDDDEHWTVGNAEGINLFQVAVHEFGHALGLAHSADRSAVMYANYRYRHNFKLENDDVRGIQALYGRKTHTWGGFNPVTRVESECQDFEINLSFKWAEGSIMLVTDWPHEYILHWRTTPNGMAPGYPKLQTTDHPDNISSEFQWNYERPIFKMCRTPLRESV